MSSAPGSNHKLVTRLPSFHSTAGSLTLDRLFVAIPMLKSASGYSQEPQFSHEWPYVDVLDPSRPDLNRGPTGAWSIWVKHDPSQPSQIEFYRPTYDQTKGMSLEALPRPPGSARTFAQGHFSSDGTTIIFPQTSDSTGPAFRRIVQGVRERTDLPVPPDPSIPLDLWSQASVWEAEVYFLKVFNAKQDRVGVPMSAFNRPDTDV